MQKNEKGKLSAPYNIFQSSMLIKNGVFSGRAMTAVREDASQITPQKILARIGLPNPRPFQEELYQNYKSRNVLIWGRGAGKDICCIAFMAAEAMKHKGKYLYAFPSAAQGRLILWAGITNALIKLPKLFPDHWVTHTDDREMLIRLVNGSTIQIVGCNAKDGDNLRGAGSKGIVFSEYAYFKNEAIWQAMQPLLTRVPNSWAFFNSTPFGPNHCKKLYDMAVKSKAWYTSIKTGEEYMSAEDLERAREEMSESSFLREYMCSWDAPIEESVYGTCLQDLNMQDNIYNPALPVYTAWDLGKIDLTSIWFFQAYNKVKGLAVNFIDFYEAANEDMWHFIDVLREIAPNRAYPYAYGSHFLPFDARLDLQVGQTREQVVLNSNLGQVKVLGRTYRTENGINQVRTFLKQGKKEGTVIFENNTRVMTGIAHLKNYAYTSQAFGIVRHDIHSHAADAFRYAVDALNILKS